MNKQIGWIFGIACALALALLVPTAGAAGCTNEALREEQGATTLPGCMALEMVSPPKKFSQPALLPSFSRSGERLLMTLQTALPGTPGYQFYGGDLYVANRGAGGWELAPTSPKDLAIVAGGLKWGSPSTFTPDLSRWAQLGATQVQVQIGVFRLFGGGLDGSFEPLSPLLLPTDNSGTDLVQFAIVEQLVDGSSADLSATVLRPSQPSTFYLPGDPHSPTPVEAGGDRNSYIVGPGEGGEPTIELLARDKDGAVSGGRCGTHIGGPAATFIQGAISPEGSRIFFTARSAQPWDPEAEEEPPCNVSNPLRILERTVTPEGPVIGEISPGSPAAPGNDIFQAASADGTKVYFATPRKLTASDVDAAAEPCSAILGDSEGCDLYLYDAGKPEGERITQASAGEGPNPADVLSSITAVSGDGSRAYFVAQGVLSADTNPAGASAQAGQPNLYLYEAESEELSFIATLAAADQGAMWGTPGSFFGDASAVPLHGPTEEAGGDGHVLAFASKAPVTDDDDDDDDGDVDIADDYRDVFRYDAVADTLELISAPLGEEEEPHEVTVNPAVAEIPEYNFGEATRWVSEDGGLIAFATAETLLPNDEDEANNPYVWDKGQLGATFASITEPPAASAAGGQIAFATPAALLPRDGDLAQDVYVAREGGGFPEPVEPVLCDPLKEGSCQGPPSQAPGPVPPPGNGANVKAPTKCKKGFVKRKGKCVKKRSKHKASKRARPGAHPNDLHARAVHHPSTAKRGGSR